jgi:Protein of unknown function (DUF3592)
MTFNLVAGALFAALALLGVVWMLSEAVYAHASQHWPHTLGSIVTSQACVELDGSGRKYVADIGYRYVVDGHEYTCDRVRFGGFRAFAWRGAAVALTKRFPVGAPVTVAYDPAKPWRGVLEPGRAGQAYLKLLIFALIAAAGLAMVTAA